VIRRALLAAAPACLLLISLTGTATGHASLVESDPPDGGIIDQTPATLTARFDEELDPDPDLSWIRIRNDADEIVARGGVTPDDDTVMIVDLPPLPPGEYRARWQARTPDDEGTTRGTINFTIEQAPAPATPTAPATLAPSAAAVTPGASATPTASPTLAPTARPSPSPSPTPAEPGTGDLLLALLAAGAVVALIAVYLMRRGRS
jgi:methionine-rich copper-binding protein CopC